MNHILKALQSYNQLFRFKSATETLWMLNLLKGRAATEVQQSTVTCGYVHLTSDASSGEEFIMTALSWVEQMPRKQVVVGSTPLQPM